MRCPCCGSEKIIWVYNRGDVICSECGFVLDSIYEPMTWDNYNERFVGKSLGSGLRRYQEFINKKERSYVIFSKIFRKIRNRPDISVDPVAFNRVVTIGDRGRSVMLLKSNRNNRALEALSKDPILKDIIVNIVSRNPLLVSRTVRGKVAVAYAIKAIKNGEKIDIKKLSEHTGISQTQAKRILRLLMRIDIFNLNNQNDS